MRADCLEIEGGCHSSDEFVRAGVKLMETILKCLNRLDVTKYLKSVLLVFVPWFFRHSFEIIETIIVYIHSLQE
jgi:hypothetical protein